MGLVSGWSLANHSNSECFHHRSAKMDASERDSGKRTDTRHLLLTFPELFLVVVAYQCVPHQDLLCRGVSETVSLRAGVASSVAISPVVPDTVPSAFPLVSPTTVSSRYCSCRHPPKGQYMMPRGTSLVVQRLRLRLSTWRGGSCGCSTPGRKLCVS